MESSSSVLEANVFKTILVPTDGSPLSEKAIDGAVDYARLANARLIGFSVVEPHLEYMVSAAAATAAASILLFAEQAAKDNLESFAKRVRDSGVQYDTVLGKGDRPWNEIILASEAQHCDAIFMASHGRKGIDAFLLGSQTQKVLVHSKLPILIYR
ncbi:MAG: universal stress protein [Burkholderiaceae bacterium]|jgi:nucleotide-binding universal stress UspA family protein